MGKVGKGVEGTLSRGEHVLGPPTLNTPTERAAHAAKTADSAALKLLLRRAIFPDTERALPLRAYTVHSACGGFLSTQVGGNE